MAATFTVDGLREVISDLDRAQSKAVDRVRDVSKKGASNLKESLNSGLAGSRHFKGAAGSVSYDEAGGLGAVEFEVGPDKQRRGGALGNIAFFGTSRGGGTVDLDGPVRSEAERFRSELQRALDGLL